MPYQAKKPGDFVIRGQTVEGRRFRPSDWVERLCGVMAGYRPGPAGPGAHLHYSPWVHPVVIDGEKCVEVDAAIFDFEPLAYRFLVNFARDNALVIEGEPLDS